MTFSSASLKNDLSAAISTSSTDRKVWLSKVVENLVAAADNAVDLAKDDNLTPDEELQHVRRSLDLHLDWEYYMENVTSDEMTMFRAVIANL